MSNQEVTVKDVIEATIMELKNVSIPAYLVQDEMLVRSVSFPVNRAINNLNLVIQVIAEAEKKQPEQDSNVIELNLDADDDKAENFEEGGSENEEKDQLEGTV